MSKQISILLILLCYLVLNMVIGIWASRSKTKGKFINNYFIGGRSMGGLVLAMTLVATYTSASSFLGGPGLASSWGLTQCWVASIQIGTAFLTLGVMGKKLAIISRKIHAVTITDYLRARYNSPLVVILCSVCLVVFFITQMVAQFIGGATLMQTVTGLSYSQGLMLFAFIVILYTAIGGFKAVVATDTMQGIIMTIGSFLLIFFIISAGGGMANIVSTLDSINPGWDLLGRGAAGEGIKALQPGYIISFWVLVGVAVMGLPQTAVRCMGFKDTKSMHRAMLYGTVIVGILMIGTHFAGVLALPLVKDAGLKSTDAVIPYVVLNYMPTWAAGLFLAAPLAAVMSTVSSLLILASATIVKEVLVTYVWKDRKNEKLIPKVSYFFTLLIGLIALIIALSPPSIIVWINLFAMGGLEATFFWALIGGLYWKKGSKYCCFGSIISGVFTFVFFNQVKILPYNIHEIVPAIIISGIVYYIIGKVRNEEPSEEVLKNCF
ncbi:MAG: sodium/pantothenate symporter [Sphaerochaetaceae bacterium]|nr:sodium/pantothenate symporter [Sphaerochaetaceae bacterium]